MVSKINELDVFDTDELRIFFYLYFTS